MSYADHPTLLTCPDTGYLRNGDSCTNEWMAANCKLSCKLCNATATFAYHGPGECVDKSGDLKLYGTSIWQSFTWQLLKPGACF